MVRATAAKMLKLFGGVYPAGHDATSFGNFALQVDSELETMALPGTISGTEANIVALANREAYRLVLHSFWAAAGGVLSGKPEPMSLHNRRHWDHIERQVKKLQAGTSYGPVAIIDMIDTSD